MEYHVDNRVVLSTEREHKNLYSWSIKEFDKTGKQIGDDQIPWAFGLNFEAIELTSSCRLNFEATDEEGASSPETKSDKSQLSEYLYGKLIPRSDSHRDSKTYSMLGTNRTLSEFDIFIHKCAIGQEERCTLWGSVSYTSEWDFENVTNKDCVQIYIYLSAEKFDQIIRLVNSRILTAVMVRLKGVEGFYSEWSPSIRTNGITILANKESQKIEIPQDLKIDPPVLGRVAEFDMSFNQKYLLKLNENNADELEEDQKDEIQRSTEPRDAELYNSILNHFVLLKKQYRRMLIPLWLVLFVLILQLLK